ncbi:hypothetical protein L7F22_001881, partial [Adiantum nelumboides]|nr:hypothetical protein [Adiantum nelumboides]
GDHSAREAERAAARRFLRDLFNLPDEQLMFSEGLYVGDDGTIAAAETFDDTAGLFNMLSGEGVENYDAAVAESFDEPSLLSLIHGRLESDSADDEEFTGVAKGEEEEYEVVEHPAEDDNNNASFDEEEYEFINHGQNQPHYQDDLDCP